MSLAKLPILLLCMLFVIAGLGMLLGSFQLLTEYQSGGYWSTTEGKIEAFSFEYDSEGGSRPRVQYSFVAGGKTYHGDRYSFRSDGFSNIEPWRPYKVGANVVVRYDPSNPSANVLNYSIDFGVYLGLAMGAVFILLSLITAYLVVKPKQEGFATP